MDAWTRRARRSGWRTGNASVSAWRPGDVIRRACMRETLVGTRFARAGVELMIDHADVVARIHKATMRFLYIHGGCSSLVDSITPRRVMGCQS